MKIRPDYSKEENTTQGGFCLTPDSLLPFKKPRKPKLPVISDLKPNTEHPTPKASQERKR